MSRICHCVSVDGARGSRYQSLTILPGKWSGSLISAIKLCDCRILGEFVGLVQAVTFGVVSIFYMFEGDIRSGIT